MKRQGDIIIKQVDQLPKGLKIKMDNIILWGEVTGHAHRLVGGQTFTDSNGNVFLNLLKTAKIVHEEHATIDLVKGKYVILRTREYDYSSQKAKEVTD